MDRAIQTVYLVGPEDKQLAESVSAMRIPCRYFETLEEFLVATDAGSRGCVIANLQLFGVGGFDVLLQLSNRRSTLPVIIISQKVSTRMVVRAMREGASTILETPTNDEDLFFAVRDAMRENEERTKKEKQAALLSARFGSLSAGEQQVLDQLCNGLSNKDIAEYLNVHVRTVEARKKRLLEKTGSDSLALLLISYQRFRITCRETTGFGGISGFDDITTPAERSFTPSARAIHTDPTRMADRVLG